MGKSLITGGEASNEASGPQDDGAAQRRSTPAKGFVPNVILSSALVDGGGSRLSSARFFLDADEDACCGGQGVLRKVWTEDGKAFALKTFTSYEAALTEWRALQDYRNFALLPEGRFFGIVESCDDASIVEAPCIVMEWIDGVSLSRYLIANGPMTVEQVLETLAKVIEFSAFAWDGARNRLVHHDIKPDNILIEAVDGGLRPRLIDFGISYAPDDQAPALATQGFAPPELFFSEDDDSAQSDDSYSIAATILVALTGETALLNGAEICKFPAYGIVQDEESGELRYDEGWTDEHENHLLDESPELRTELKSCYIRNPRRRGLVLTEQEMNAFAHEREGEKVDGLRKAVRESLSGTYGKRVTEEELDRCLQRAFGAMDRRVKRCLSACLNAVRDERPTSAELKAALPLDAQAYFHELQIIAVANALGGRESGSALAEASASAIDLGEDSVLKALDDYNSGRYDRCLPVFDKIMRTGGSHSAIYNIAVMARDDYAGAGQLYSDQDIVQMMAEAANAGNLLAQNWYGRVLVGKFEDGEPDLRKRTVRDADGNRIRVDMDITPNVELGLKYVRESARDDREQGRQGFHFAKKWLAENKEWIRENGYE